MGQVWIRIRPDPSDTDPVWIRIRPDLTCQDPAWILIRPEISWSSYRRWWSHVTAVTDPWWQIPVGLYSDKTCEHVCSITMSDFYLLTRCQWVPIDIYGVMRHSFFRQFCRMCLPNTRPTLSGLCYVSNGLIYSKAVSELVRSKATKARNSTCHAPSYPAPTLTMFHWQQSDADICIVISYTAKINYIHGQWVCGHMA